MMEDISGLINSSIIINKRFKTNFNGNKVSNARSPNYLFIDALISEGGEYFYHYLDKLGISSEPNMMLIPARHNYYDCNDLTGVNILINLRRLNLIKHLDSFFHVLGKELSRGASFIGCFSENRLTKSIDLDSLNKKRQESFLRSKTSPLKINKTDVSRLLDQHGFATVDMSEIGELTFFRAISAYFC
jgi:hypothetical protein